MEEDNEQPGSDEEEIDPDLYRNFEFQKKPFIRNKSAKKELEDERKKRKLDDINLKKNQREKTLEKNKPIDLGFGLKGMKMNVKKKR